MKKGEKVFVSREIFLRNRSRKERERRGIFCQSGVSRPFVADTHTHTQKVKREKQSQEQSAYLCG